MVLLLYTNDMQIAIPLVCAACAQGLHGPWLIDAMSLHSSADDAWTRDEAEQWILTHDDRWGLSPMG